MPDVTITGLPDATTPLSGAERVAMDQSGVTRDGTTQDIANLAAPTNLSYTPATRILASSTGTDATLTVVDGVNDGLITSLQAIKLNEIEPLADRTTQAKVLTALDGATIDNAVLNDALVTATALTDGATPSIDAIVAPLRTWTLGANGRTPSITWGAATAARSITLLINGNGFDTINWSTIAPTWVGVAPAISSTGVTAVTFMRVDGITYGFGPPPRGLGNITSAGAIGSTANLPLITTTAGVVTVGSFGTTANTFCQGNDSRLSDARTPTAHNQAWSTITATPTTRSGYGITDAAANGAITGSGLTLATARLVGRTTAATGAPEEVSVGASLSLSAGVLNLGATPALGTPASGTLSNCTGLPVAGIVASTSAALGVGTIELGAVADTTISRASAGVVAVEGVALARVIGAGTAAMGTAAIASAASATVVTVAATGVLTTDVIDWGFNANPNSVTGYSAASVTGCLVITAYPTAGNVNFVVSNPTAGSITPGALTLNWRVVR